MLKPLALLIAVAVIACPAASAPLDGAAPARVHVELTSFRITPAAINLERGHRYILEIENGSGSSHDFTAREFFASVELSPEDQAKVQGGEIELEGHHSATIMLTPTRAGTFEFHCAHLLHSTLGMRGEIHVS